MYPIKALAGIAMSLLLSMAYPVSASVNVPSHAAECIDGFAEGFPCSKVNLQSHVDIAALGGLAGEEGNDIWGWTDPLTGSEYAMMGINSGTVFVDVTIPDEPVVLGKLPTHSSNSIWRDIKVYADHAYVVSEASSHGLQVFDLSRLRNVVSPPVTFTEDGYYGEFGRAHNIVINEDSGFAYAVGSKQGTTQCNGGLHMISLAVPDAPTFAGCFSADGYTHDAQCVMYSGPDIRYTGSEICLASNEDTLTIVDVSNKSAPVQLARVGYPGSAYTHQGWFAPGQQWYLMDDELDEQGNGHNTRTYVWDLTDLENPVRSFEYTGPTAAIDHNLYIRDQYAFQSNYKSGLRILDISGIETGTLTEVGFFDTYPAGDDANFDGSWSNYPFFASGNVIVSDISRGLFVLEPILCEEPAMIGGVSASGTGPNQIDVAWTAAVEAGATYEVYRELGGCAAGPGELIAEGLSSPLFSDLTASGSVNYGYRVRAVDTGGQCRSAFSACVQTTTSGSCTAPPGFAGLATASSAGTANCEVDLDWVAAAPNCAGPVQYEVHRDIDSDFIPSAGNLIESVSGLSTTDFAVTSGQRYYYAVRARDEENGSSESNLVRLSVTPMGPVSTGAWTNGAEDGDVLLGADIGASAVQHVAWHAVDDIAHTGTRSYFSSYADGECLALSSSAIDLGASNSSILSFYQRYGIEAGWDGGRVEISTNGTTWTPIAPTGGYTTTITSGGNACGWTVGTGVFSGTALGWAQKSFDLSAYSGTVYLRWIFSTDGGVTGPGWWIDDIAVSPAEVAGSCTTVVSSTTLDITSHLPSPSGVGVPVDVKFSLEGTPASSGTPTGSVTVAADGAGESCTVALPAGSCSLVLDAAGARTLTASFAGDGVFPAATGSIVHNVTPATPVLALSVVPASPSTAGDVAVSISLTGPMGIAAPSGTVSIESDLEAASCNIVVPATSCMLSLHVAGLHTLTATYPGDSRYQGASDTVSKLIYDTPALFLSGFE